MFSLDTDTVNGIIRGNPRIFQRARSVPDSDQWISTIVVEEIVGGQIGRINTLRSRKRSMERESRFLADLISSLSTLQILPYTDEAEQLYQSWTAKQKRVGPNDCRIAARAILAGFTVITCNGKDFSTIPDVDWQDWSQP
ncbi:MAG: type II toxin-antitoxin system VapC family toxin [Janthinobacterium lividum]